MCLRFLHILVSKDGRAMYYPAKLVCLNARIVTGVYFVYSCVKKGKHSIRKTFQYKIFATRCARAWWPTLANST